MPLALTDHQRLVRPVCERFRVEGGAKLMFTLAVPCRLIEPDGGVGMAAPCQLGFTVRNPVYGVVVMMTYG